jgi:pimeloyl-ACP methyl ester carboxylesterase
MKDRLYDRRALLRLAALTGAGVAGVLVLGCGSEDTKEESALPTSPPPTVPPSGFFDSDGVKIHYETYGEGSPIVLVHGFAASIQLNWAGTGWVDTLKPVRRVVALDCRGHGLSDKPHDAAAYDSEKMQQDVLNLMDYLAIQKADLFGYSMGSFISAALLAYHRERFTSVVLGGIGNVLKGLPVDTGRSIAAALAADDPSTVTDPVGLGFRNFAESDPNNDLKALAACSGNPAPPIDAAVFSGVDIPVLIVKGANDTTTENAEPTAAVIPGARLVSIPDTDHLTVVPDQRFKDEVLTFLE